ncbi:MAG: Rieske 2Fe-2S domain-containing protein [Acidobacteria bacterium]|nr:Rieske 2Fe-2S domain-containing protein [Acidobacteriota bacterium]
MSDKRLYKIATKDEIKPGSGKSVNVGRDTIAIFNFDGEFYALDDLCPHRGAPLCEGFLDAGKVFCPWHCFDFNLKTGESETIPSMRVQAYELKIDGDDIYLLY